MQQSIPKKSFISGRKGKASVADYLIHSLTPDENSNDEPPSKSIGDLTSCCAVGLGFEVASSTIRSTLYRHPEIFERDEDKCGAHYKLSTGFVKENL